MVTMSVISMTAEMEYAKTPQFIPTGGASANMDGGDHFQKTSHSHIFHAPYQHAH